MTTQTIATETIEEKPTVGMRIRAARDKKKLTRQALAELVDVSAKTIEKYEDGSREPPLKRLEVLAEHLDVPVSYFVESGDAPGNVPGYDIPEQTVHVQPETEQPEETETEAVLSALDNIDRMRMDGFENAPRKVAALIDHVRDMLRPLEPTELHHVANVRGVHPDECSSLLDLFDFFGSDLDAGQHYCGNVEERIIDTAVLGIDLYWIEDAALLELAERIGVKAVNEFALPHWWESNSGYEALVPELRPLLRSAAIVGNGKPFSDDELFPRRELEAAEDEW